jgi:acyl-CoA synthetase (AMP-forming)/AMP-acid ligase II
MSDKLAVSDGVNRLTYSDTFSAVENLSRRIATAVADGQAVGILLANLVWYPVAMLACMVAGRPSVPFNTRDPGSRIGEIAVAARLSAVIGAGRARHGELPQKVQWIDVAASVAATDSRTPASHVRCRLRRCARHRALIPRAAPDAPRASSTASAALLRRVVRHRRIHW